MLGVYRDITNLKEREEALAAAKDAAIAARDEAAAARADVERTREALQTVLDNMSDGVMLLAEGGRLRFVNRRLAEFQQYPPELLKPGTTIREIMRHQAERGDFGPGRDPEAIVEERLAIVASPGGNRYELFRRFQGPLFRIQHIKLLDDIRLADRQPRHHRTEGPRRGACRRQGGGRGRTRRRGAHPPGDADRAR